MLSSGAYTVILPLSNSPATLPTFPPFLHFTQPPQLLSPPPLAVPDARRLDVRASIIEWRLYSAQAMGKDGEGAPYTHGTSRTLSIVPSSKDGEGAPYTHGTSRTLSIVPSSKDGEGAPYAHSPSHTLSIVPSSKDGEGAPYTHGPSRTLSIVPSSKDGEGAPYTHSLSHTLSIVPSSNTHPAYYTVHLGRVLTPDMRHSSIMRRMHR